MELWREIQKKNFTSLKKLVDFLTLSENEAETLIKNHPFPLNVPLRLAEKMQKKTLDDPLLKQFLPLPYENSSSFTKDPVLDKNFLQTSKLLQKYEGRALLLVTSACVMHCRYCFRQHFNYETTRKDFEKEIRLIQQDPSLEEIILSGGDPLSLNHARLSSLISELDSISHVKRIRFHTRFPIGIPERIDDKLLSLFSETRAQIWFLIHVNHPHELDDEIFSALKKIQKLSIPILTQTVLLKGVNDSFSTLKNLFQMLINHGIQPYYLHQLDPVSGSEIFSVSDSEGKRLIEEIRASLPGYAIPLFVKEIPHQLHKTVL